MKKILKYMQDTAANPSATLAYLAPPGPEPQQRTHHREHRRRKAEAQHHKEFHNENYYPSAAAHTTPSHVSGSNVGAGRSFEMERHQYAQENLHQSYDVYVPEHDEHTNPEEMYWVIYLHGGAYRDPQITSTSFHKTLSLLFSSPLYAHTAASIAGFASINYRLSPHPDYPQDPNKTSNYELRNAKHPDHINDVVTAIAALQKKYAFGERYLLVGHSVGATMAMQVALSRSIPWDPTSGDSVCEPPTVILAVAGNYDYPLLLRTHEPKELYEGFVYGAFGKDQETLEKVSPSLYGEEVYVRNWKLKAKEGEGEGEGRKRVVVVAHSQQDEYVQMSQPKGMIEVLAKLPERRFKYKFLELKGKHDAMWAKGEEMSRAIAVALREMMKVNSGSVGELGRKVEETSI